MLVQGNRMQPVARIDETFTFTYVGNNSNETVWPGTCMYLYCYYLNIAYCYIQAISFFQCNYDAYMVLGIVDFVI